MYNCTTKSNDYFFDAMDKVNVQVDKFRKSLDKIPALQKLEQDLKVDKFILVVAAGGLALLMLLTFYGMQLITDLVGFLYPALRSFQAIETTHSKKDDVQWLTYWTVFAVFSIFEVFLKLILYVFPYYFSVKLAVVIWMMHPATRGASSLYENFLQPMLAHHEANIDAAIKHANQHGVGVVADLSGAVSDVAQEGVQIAASMTKDK